MARWRYDENDDPDEDEVSVIKIDSAQSQSKDIGQLRKSTFYRHQARFIGMMITNPFDNFKLFLMCRNSFEHIPFKITDEIYQTWEE